ncbi:major surface trophozoite antigen 11-like [Haliotis cracherodii]|uniref:major surface trophozoite antigen 11-like n=1 Tax=Haliotis cracherodii TaxID=6455 RepID=UPI0039E74CC6
MAATTSLGTLVSAILIVTCGLNVQALIMSAVPCPNIATNCVTDTFNAIIPNLGCLGCQGGCVDGYMMTSNPRHRRDTNDTSGHYTYRNVPIQNTVDVMEPQWICVKGDHCLTGFFHTQMGPQSACAWCGDGCSTCSSYNNCQSCFWGYKMVRHTLPGGKQTAVCKPSGVKCPSKNTHCSYTMYVRSSVGCLGCTSCDEGYLPTFNHLYYRVTTDPHGSYTFNNITIKNNRDVNEPRLVCVKGQDCRDGWFRKDTQRSSFCDWCGEGCSRCTDNTSCSKCDPGYTLNQTGTKCTANST